MNKARHDSLTRLANAAFREVAIQIIEQAKQTGIPVILWEDGQVKAVPGEELEKRMRQRSRKKTKRPNPTKD